MKRLGVPSLVLALCLLCVGVATPARAQISAIGSGSFLPLPPAFPPTVATLGVDSSFDPVNGVFLTIYAAGPFGVAGVFVDVNGTAVGAPFVISTTAGHVNYGRARYSPHVNNSTGGFLVSWISEDGPQGLIHVHTRIAAYPGVVVGVENVISDAANRAWPQAAPAIGYSPTSQKFLVTWQALSAPLGVKARFVGLDGAGSGAIVNLATEWCRDPGVTWNPNRDEFGVSFSGENQTSGGVFSGLSIVPASNIAASRLTTFNNMAAAVVAMTDVAFSTLTNRYVMVWFETVAGNLRVRSAEFNEDGTKLSDRIVGFTFGGYDSLALAFNPVSRTLLAVGLQHSPATDAISGVELNGVGVALSSEMAFGTGQRGFYARVSAATNVPRWNTVYSGVLFKAGTINVVTTSTNGGGGGGGGETIPTATGSRTTWMPVRRSPVPSRMGARSSHRRRLIRNRRS